MTNLDILFRGDRGMLQYPDTFQDPNPKLRSTFNIVKSTLEYRVLLFGTRHSLNLYPLTPIISIWELITNGSPDSESFLMEDREIIFRIHFIFRYFR